jgi:hypothetical protein
MMDKFENMSVNQKQTNKNLKELTKKNLRTPNSILKCNDRDQISL